jgi:rRNA maturation endonuclease Nob1
MRPTDVPYDKELYECVDCIDRVKAPETRRCGACGGELQQISRSRDL